MNAEIKDLTIKILKHPKKIKEYFYTAVYNIQGL